MTVDVSDLSPQLRYRSIQQPGEPPPLRLETILVTPAMAADWLRRSDQDETFHNRPTRVGDVRRWKLLMETDRFIHYLPDGPILFDADGILLNGKHRLNAICGHGQPAGLTVIRDVPRWMMEYFDSGRPRNLNDLFVIKGRASTAQTGSACRLAMRYEEVLFGKRPALAWKLWPGHRDEFPDVDDFLGRRSGLMDLYHSAEVVYRGSRIVIAASMVFRFYQELAWPEGDAVLQRFWEGLAKGAMLQTGDPALALREWSRDVYTAKDRIPAKRESHLFLLNGCFTAAAQGAQIQRIQLGYGLPMPVPYHPNGPRTAVTNIHRELNALDGDSTRGTTATPTRRRRSTSKAAAGLPEFRA